MRDKFQRFMQGRYGADELCRFLTALGLILIVVRRYAENQKFLSWRSRLRSGPSRWKADLEQRKVYHIYRCPSCRQKIRVPRGKGYIIVSCPKCRTEFRKKS